MTQTPDSVTPRKVNRHGQPVHEFLVRLEEPLYNKLVSTSRQQGRTKVDVIRTALRHYLLS